jgi:hypothetical protein
MVESWLHDIALNRQRDGNIVANQPRQSPEQLPIPDRVLNFDEVEQPFTYEAAAKEAERCLRCYRVMLMAIASEK